MSMLQIKVDRINLSYLLVLLALSCAGSWFCIYAFYWFGVFGLVGAIVLSVVTLPYLLYAGLLLIAMFSPRLGNVDRKSPSQSNAE